MSGREKFLAPPKMKLKKDSGLERGKAGQKNVCEHSGQGVKNDMSHEAVKSIKGGGRPPGDSSNTDAYRLVQK